jgi:hypothetical protein
MEYGAIYLFLEQNGANGGTHNTRRYIKSIFFVLRRLFPI